MNNITLGSDPEFAIYNTKTQEFISGVGLIGGTKKRPLSIGNKCFKQEDNVGVEFNIPPISNPNEAYNYIKYCIDEGNKIVSEINPDYIIKATSSAIYSKDELNSKKAQTFGCSESYCIYTQDLVVNPKDPGFLRSFGFHVHVGSTDSMDTDDITHLVKLMDIYLAVPAVIIDIDKERRKLYGKAGEFRFCDYGFEYRVLGGNLLGDKKLIDWVFNQTMNIINNRERLSIIDSDKIQECINNSDVKLAEEICSNLDIIYPKIKILNENKVFEI